MNFATRRGFTLVELLIVVAIIGVLSLIGIPTYKRMVQKAKKSEAKASLAGLYTAEVAFFAEFGAYGNNLPKLGYDIAGLGDVKILGFYYEHPGSYSIGFTVPGVCGGMGIRPFNDPWKARIQEMHPEYYSDVVTHYPIEDVLPGVTFCLGGGVPKDGTTFTATASGVIAPGVDRFSGVNNDHDQWTINHLRELTNVYDGVK